MAINKFSDFLVEFRKTGGGSGFGSFQLKRFGNDELQPTPQSTGGGGGNNFGGGGGDIGDDGDLGDDEPEGEEGRYDSQDDTKPATPSVIPLSVDNEGYSVEFEWEDRLTPNIIKQNAPASAVCAIIYGSNYEKKTRSVQYFDKMVADRDEPYFPSEGEKLMSRKLLKLK